MWRPKRIVKENKKENGWGFEWRGWFNWFCCTGRIGLLCFQAQVWVWCNGFMPMTRIFSPLCREKEMEIKAEVLKVGTWTCCYEWNTRTNALMTELVFMPGNRICHDLKLMKLLSDPCPSKSSTEVIWSLNII